MNPCKKLFSIAVCLAIGTRCLIGGNALAFSITATAVDDDTFTPTTAPEVQDGDFWIRSRNSQQLTGNGWSEFVFWDFDFNSDPDVANFRNTVLNLGQDLTEALITFTVTPTNHLITTDTTGIEEGQAIRIPSLPDVVYTVNQEITFSFDLLDYGFDSTNILNALNSGELNSIPWFWQDDVSVHYASLTLTTEEVSSVPEPASILGLLALGTICATTIKRKKETN